MFKFLGDLLLVQAHAPSQSFCIQPAKGFQPRLFYRAFRLLPRLPDGKPLARLYSHGDRNTTKPSLGRQPDLNNQSILVNGCWSQPKRSRQEITLAAMAGRTRQDYLQSLQISKNT